MSAAGLPATAWQLCAPLPYSPVVRSAPRAGNDAGAVTEMTADEGEARHSNIFTLRGSVMIQRPGEVVEADSAYYESDSEWAEVHGNVRLQRGPVIIEGSDAELDLANDRGRIDNPGFFLLDRHARGSAATIHLENRDISRLTRALYTTCDPGDNDWALRSREIRLDRASGIGTATHATLWFQGVPFFYFPYLSFPITDERKSGFLLPSVGTSDVSGTEISIPYYWNIAPNYDATITPRSLWRRGLQVQTELRYLTSRSTGRLDYEYLPDDDLFGADRRLSSLQHATIFSRRWDAGIQATKISDSRYFEDLENNLSLASITHLEQRADVNYINDNAVFSGRVQKYQTVDETIPAGARPYQLLPQLRWGMAWLPPGFGPGFSIEGELVNFERDASVTGLRFDIAPRLSLPYETLATFFIPQLTVRHTRYQLDNQQVNTLEAPTRTVPLLSLDSGIFLERDLAFGTTRLLQTLEPRLFYLYVPERDQSSLPLFDTDTRDFSFAELFRENRFTGADRVGDANQLSTGITSRFIDKATGAERLRAGVGQIVYFDDRDVRLSGTTPETRNNSDLVAELAVYAGPWRTMAEWQWNPDAGETEKGTFSLQYHPTAGRVVNLSYRFRDDVLQQTDLSFLWPLHSRWRAVGRWNYSVRDEQDLEWLAGLEYESCCWRLSMIRRSIIDTASNDMNKSLFVELELKGLTSLGQRVEDMLERGILGYTR